MAPFELFTPTEEEAPHVYPTQILHPFLAVVRTIVAVVAGTVLFLVGLIGALAMFLPQFLAAVVDVLPENWIAPLTAAVLSIGAISGAITRVMAIPGVNEFLTKLSLGATPKQKALR